MFFIAVSLKLYPQSCTVNAGIDTFICQGQSIGLIGSGTGLNFHWQVNNGLIDTNSLSPVVSPSITTIYVLQSDFISSTNLITNGDFSNGNSGFTSGYLFNPPPNLTEGEYWVSSGSQVQTWNPGMANCPDHTTGMGNMMIVNGATITNIPVWCQTINIQPNTNYVFTCWLQTLTLPILAQLQFSINGIPIGSIFTASMNLCTWQQFYTIWNSGINTSVNICIVNQNSIATANDFALDDILFSPICTAYDSVTVMVNANTGSNNPQSICSGQSYSINSHSYNLAGTYYDTLLSASSCDSVVITQLSVNSSTYTNNSQSVCSGQSYSLNGHNYYLDGTYYDTLSSNSGCDSIIITQLMVNTNIPTNNPQTICSGFSYSINSHNYNTGGTFYDTLSTLSGCDSIIMTTISVNNLPLINFFHPNDLCIDAPLLTLNYAFPSGGIYSGMSVINNAFNPQLAAVGTHILSYFYIDPQTNCSNTVYENITVHPLPVVEFSFTPNNSLFEGTEISFVDWTPGAISWQWNFGDSAYSQNKQDVHTYYDTGYFNVSLFVVDNFGCKNYSQDSIFISKEFAFYAPNAFTPNGDGINDYFRGLGIGISNYNMSIFNKWGKLIFEADNIESSWDGKNMPSDTYVYKIKLKDLYGTSYEYVGRVSIVR